MQEGIISKEIKQKKQKKNNHNFLHRINRIRPVVGIATAASVTDRCELFALVYIGYRIELTHFTNQLFSLCFSIFFSINLR